MFTPLSNLDRYNILLASRSPRRSELLRDVLRLDFSLAPPHDTEEIYPKTLKVEEVPEYLARLKALPYTPAEGSNDLIITADTIVAIDGEVIGKPANEDEARAMLSKLSGRTHTVVSGVAVTVAGRQESFTATTEVTFSELLPEEIDYYVAKFHPFDKAGAYGIQEWIGGIGVEKINGSFYNVMGLPIQRLYALLKTF